MNGTRLGLYEPLKSAIQTSFDSLNGGQQVYPYLVMVASGALSGITGAFVASPIFLIKTVRFFIQPWFDLTRVENAELFLSHPFCRTSARVHQQGSVVCILNHISKWRHSRSLERCRYIHDSNWNRVGCSIVYIWSDKSILIIYFSVWRKRFSACAFLGLVDYQFLCLSRHESFWCRHDEDGTCLSDPGVK